MTPEDLRAIRELMEKATPGPWVHYDEVFRAQFSNRRVTEIQTKRRTKGRRPPIVAWSGFDALPSSTGRKANANAALIVAAINALPALLSAAEQGARAEEALRRIERWEMPPTNEKWNDGSPMSYVALFGSQGARDVIREIARAALPQSPSKVEEG